MLETVKAFMASHPYVSAYIAIAVVSIALRIAGSKWWATVKASHPKLAGLIEIARGAGFDFPKIAQGVLRIAYAMLPPPVGGASSGETKPNAPPSTPSSGGAYRMAISGLEAQRLSRPRPAGPCVGLQSFAFAMLAWLSLAAGISSCAWWQSRGAADVSDEGKVALLCIESKFDQLLLADDKMKAAEQIAKECGTRVGIDFILRLLDVSSQAHERAVKAGRVAQ